MKNNSKLSINIVLVIFTLSILIFLINKNFPISGEVTFSAVLNQDTPEISRLGPPPRVKLENDYQLILEGPVYFDIRSVSWLNKARIEIVYQDGDRKLKGLGGQAGAGDWQYALQAPDEIISIDGNYQKAIFYFDLNNLYRKRNVSRFLIDTTGETQQTMKIKEINIALNRK